MGAGILGVKAMTKQKFGIRGLETYEFSFEFSILGSRQFFTRPTPILKHVSTLELL